MKFFDLVGQSYRPISSVFSSLRPDIVLKHQKTISTLELTICHETNAIAQTFQIIRAYNNTETKSHVLNIHHTDWLATQ